MNKHKALILLLFFAASCAASDPVTQPYRPLGEPAQWTIEGQASGLLKVRISINGQEIANGSMKDAPFESIYENQRVRVTCAVGSLRIAGAANQSCSVYVGNELAANLIFVRN